LDIGNNIASREDTLWGIWIMKSKHLVRKREKWCAPQDDWCIRSMSFRL